MARPTHFWRASHQLSSNVSHHANLHVHKQLTKQTMQEALHSMFFGVQTYSSERAKRYFYRQHAIIIALMTLIMLAIVIGFFQIIY